MTDSHSKTHYLRRFIKEFDISGWSLVYLGALMVLSIIGQMFSAGLLIPFLNSLQKAPVTSDTSNKFLNFTANLFSQVPTEERFVYILLIIIGLMIFVQITMLIINREIFRFSLYAVQYKAANTLFEKLLNSRLKFFYKHNSGNLINNITQDVGRCLSTIVYGLKIAGLFLFIAGYIAVGMAVLPTYMLGLCVMVGLLALSGKYIMPFFYRLGIEARDAQDDTNNMIIETLQGIRSVILSCAQKTHLQKFNVITQKYYKSVFRSTWLSSAIPTIINLAALVIIFGFLMMNRQAILNTQAEYFSKVIFFLYITGNIFLNVGKIKQMYSSYAFNFEGVKALLTLKGELDEYNQKETQTGKPIHGFFQSIAISQLRFEYIKGIQIVDNLSLSIPAHQSIAFVGSSGSGKSTMIDLISGFHDDYQGSIKIDGQELREINKTDWRNLLGYVSQESFIFNDTVRNNLLFGFKKSISDDMLIDACKKAQIYETILSFPQQFETRLGERGIRLSGGEKQRLAIARLFLKNPPIVLLDEATSSLDSESERKVKEALAILSYGRTVIAVAHRLSTISDFDKIYVLEKGVLVESGNHHELIAQKGYYYRYNLIQTMVNTPEETHVR